ncbi:MAG: hypothetical protein ABW186_15440, partial [Rhodanobacteraceae bacterium]
MILRPVVPAKAVIRFDLRPSFRRRPESTLIFAPSFRRRPESTLIFGKKQNGSRPSGMTATRFENFAGSRGARGAEARCSARARG